MRIHVVIPDDIVAEVDALVGPRSRSKFFTDAARAYLKRQRLLTAALAAGGSLKDVDIPGWETSESAAEWVHRLRYGDEEVATEAVAAESVAEHAP